MAEIPIKKKKASIWPWLILGALALIAVLAIWAAVDDDDEAEMRGEEVAAVEDERIADVPAGAITTTAALTASTPDLLDGKELRIDQMRVTRVVGDRTFYVAEPNGDRQFLVVTDEPAATAGSAPVSEGQTIRIIGTVEQPQEADANTLQLTEQEAQAMRGDQLYLRAQQLDVRT